MSRDLIDSLIKHEDVKLYMYVCPAGKQTIGVGHNLERPISREAAMQILLDDIEEAKNELNRAFPRWAEDINQVRQEVLIEMCFNIGAPRLSSFKKMWGALKAFDFDKAADEMLDSRWADQVGQRAETLSLKMRIGR